MLYSASELRQSLQRDELDWQEKQRSLEMSRRGAAQRAYKTPPRIRGIKLEDPLTPSELVRQFDGELGDALKDAGNAGRRLQNLVDAVGTRLGESQSRNAITTSIYGSSHLGAREPPRFRPNAIPDIGLHDVHIVEAPRGNASGESGRARGDMELEISEHPRAKNYYSQRQTVHVNANEEEGGTRPHDGGDHLWQDRRPEISEEGEREAGRGEARSHEELTYSHRLSAIAAEEQQRQQQLHEHQQLQHRDAEKKHRQQQQSLAEITEHVASMAEEEQSVAVQGEILRTESEILRTGSGKEEEEDAGQPQLLREEFLPRDQWPKDEMPDCVRKHVKDVVIHQDGNAFNRCGALFFALQAKSELWGHLEKAAGALNPDPEERHKQEMRLLAKFRTNTMSRRSKRKMEEAKHVLEKMEADEHEEQDSKAEEPAHKLLTYLNDRKKHDKEFFFRFSPVGEIPLHLFYLFQVNTLCMDIITEVYPPAHINIPYRSNLRWLQDTNNEGGVSIRKKVLDPQVKIWKKDGRIPPNSNIDSKENHWDRMGLFTGETTLHMAIANKRVSSVKALLKMNADVMATAVGAFFSPQMMTPLLRVKLEKEGGTFSRSRLRRQESSAAISRRVDQMADRRVKFYDIRTQSLLKWHRGLHMIPNLDSTFYAGQYPFSFAAYVGSIEIMTLLLEGERKKGGGRGRDMLMNMDEFDNTALHMAVYGNSEEAFDWLMECGCSECLTQMNIMGLTPVTLAASLGNSKMLMHIFRSHLAKVLWLFSDIAAQEIQLAQLDSFRMDEMEMKDDTHENEGSYKEFMRGYKEWANGQPVQSDDDSDVESNRRPSASDPSPVSEVERMVGLHKSKRYRSALEIVVSHQVDEIMTSEGTNEVKELMLKLINTKWERFAARMHFRYRVIPYIALLTLFTFTIVWKAAVMRQEHLYDKEDQEAWVPAYAISVAVLEGVVFSFGMPFLLYSGYRNVRIKLSDLDVNMNNDIAFSEVMIFTYKNMPSFLDFANGIGLIVCAICRAVGAENASLAFASVITVLLWCNLTSLLVPSRFFGSLVFIIYRTFVSDITKFLFIYMILNFAFGFSFFLLLQKSTFPQDEKEQEVLCKDCDVYVGKMILKLVYVSLGETDQSILMEHMRDPILAIIMHNVYSVMSLILLLNLIIAMMGDTFQKGFKDSERDWFYPFAELVLRYEKMLPKSKQRFYRVGNTSNRSHKETAGKDAPERGEAATKQVKKLLDPFHVYVKITRGEDDKHPVVIL